MPKKLPKISIITPSYNQAQYINQTIQSVVLQKYPHLEYLVMDGGSTDGTISILKKYDRQIRWISEKDKGQTDAINKGLKIVSGEIIGYLNSDDILENNCLNKVGKFFAANPQFFWVTGKCYIIDANGDKNHNLVTAYKNLFLKYLRSRNVLFVLNYISQPATFWRREIVDNIGLFNDSFHFSMDYDYWLRIFKKYELGFINDYLASFRVHQASKGSRKPHDQLDESYRIAKSFASSKLLLMLHKLHDIISSCLYETLYSTK